jgi:hypothetical protein
LGYDKKYLVWALGYAAVGMCLGIVMAATHDHGQLVTHAHINLVGFLLSLSYGIIHKLWLAAPNPAIAKMQFILHQAASIPLFVGLFLLYGRFVPEAQIDPFLAVASIVVLSSALMMLYMVIKANAVK